jgi:hypothetical protein
MAVSFAFMAKPPKRPRDSAQLAKFIVEIASGERENDKPTPETLSAAKGGRVRAKKLSAERRKAIAKKAARARWGK